ncbi:MAG: hypothetical protein DWC11_00625 [Candidatus Poseidoniales archaeon]|nr:MAG: hypothetical protein DWC11_00625 [Candidatus Poseidoniales archaeon]
MASKLPIASPLRKKVPPVVAFTATATVDHASVGTLMFASLRGFLERLYSEAYPNRPSLR